MIITDKHDELIDIVLNDKPWWVTLEGVARSSKTIIAIFIFGLLIAKDDSEGEVLSCMAAQDYDALRDNLLEKELGFNNIFKGLVTYKKHKIGGYYLEFTTPYGVRKILLAGYSNKKRWEKILGKDIKYWLIDEVNVADMDFVRESEIRKSQFDDAVTICTLNGDDPDKDIYKHIIDKGIIWREEETPQSTIELMEETEKDTEKYNLYTFWNMHDNPIMSDSKIKRAMSLYPEGSYYYNTKLLGIRGVQEGALYAPLINSRLFIEFKKISLASIVRYEIGIDIGDKAYTVFTLTGYTKNFQRVIVMSAKGINRDSITDLNYTMIINEFFKWVDPFYRMFGHKIRAAWVDSADSLFIKELRSKNIYPQLSIKSSKKETIKERIDLKQQLLWKDRLLFVREYGALEVAKMLKKMMADGKGGHIDENDAWNDYNDSLDYSLTPHMRKLVRFEGI